LRGSHHMNVSRASWKSSALKITLSMPLFAEA
jgi:hypothetical protein